MLSRPDIKVFAIVVSGLPADQLVRLLFLAHKAENRSRLMAGQIPTASMKEKHAELGSVSNENVSE
jgi:hypothetical protein